MDPARRRFIQKAAGVSTIGIAGLAGCSGDGDGNGGNGNGNGNGNGGGTETEEATSTPQETIDAAFVNLYSTASGWVKAHDTAQDRVEEELPWVNVQRQREVAAADVQQVLQSLAEEGYDAIFANATEYQSAVESLSVEYPDTAWYLVSAAVTSDDFSVFLSRDYEPAYVAGYASGLLTESDLLGYVAAYPYPGTNRKANAFALGAKAANPDAEVMPNWSGTWYDPPVERDATSVVINEGADVVMQWSDSGAVMQECNDQGVWGVSGVVPWTEEAGDSYLTGVLNTWEGYYIDQLQQIRDGEYEPSFDWWGMSDGMCDIGDGDESDDDLFGSEVPSDVIEETNGIRQDMLDGNIDVWAGSQYEGESDDYIHTEMTEPVENIRGDFEE